MIGRQIVKQAETAVPWSAPVVTSLDGHCWLLLYSVTVVDLAGPNCITMQPAAAAWCLVSAERVAAARYPASSASCE